MAADEVEVEVGDRSVRISNPGRVYFPTRGETKLDLVRYYLSVGDGIVRALRERPCMMHRFPSGVAGEKVHQKRVPHGAPPWLETVRVDFPRYGRHADELCVTELASVVWAVQMSTVEFHPWNSRRADVERPDEWRIDLDPMPHCGFATVRRVAHIVREILGELGATGWPKTSGGNGLHIYVRTEPRWGFAELRRAAHAFAREVERRAPDEVTTTWWRKDRDPAMLFVDYNQNARDHTIASAYSVRGVPEATVSTPSPGTRSTRSTRASSPSPPSPPASPSSATCTTASMTPPTRWTPCSNGQNATGSTRTAHHPPATARTGGRPGIPTISARMHPRSRKRQITYRERCGKSGSPCRLFAALSARALASHQTQMALFWRGAVWIRSSWSAQPGSLTGGWVPAGNPGGGEPEPESIGGRPRIVPRREAERRRQPGSLMPAGGSRSREEVLRRLHFAVEDLAGGALGQFADEPDIARVLVCRHPFSGKRGRFRWGGYRPELHRGAEFLAKLAIRDQDVRP